MSKPTKRVSIDQAKTIVRKAMKVIVDFMLHENNIAESNSSLYAKVHAVDNTVIKALGEADFNDDKTAQEFYRLARNIMEWDEDHLSFLGSEPCPQRWMFKTMI